MVCNIGDDADVFVTLYEPPGANEKEGRFIRCVLYHRYRGVLSRYRKVLLETSRAGC